MRRPARRAGCCRRPRPRIRRQAVGANRFLDFGLDVGLGVRFHLCLSPRFVGRKVERKRAAPLSRSRPQKRQSGRGGSDHARQEIRRLEQGRGHAEAGAEPRAARAVSTAASASGPRPATAPSQVSTAPASRRPAAWAAASAAEARPRARPARKPAPRRAARESRARARSAASAVPPPAARRSRPAALPSPPRAPAPRSRSWPGSRAPPAGRRAARGGCACANPPARAARRRSAPARPAASALPRPTALGMTAPGTSSTVEGSSTPSSSACQMPVAAMEAVFRMSSTTLSAVLMSGSAFITGERP